MLQCYNRSSVADSNAGFSADPKRYDLAIGQMADHCCVIRIAGRLSYERSILDKFNHLTLIMSPGNGRRHAIGILPSCPCTR